MDCHAFRAAHLDLTDGTLASAERAAALAHRDECPECARYDCRVRRSVLLVRNLPEVLPRPGFDVRLRARLSRDADLEQERRRHRAVVLRSAAAAASVAIILGAWSLATRRTVPVVPVAVVPSTATLPQPVTRAPAMLSVQRASGAVAAWGIPLWSAAITLEQTPARFAASGSPPFPPAR